MKETWILVMLNVTFTSGPYEGHTKMLPMTTHETKEECIKMLETRWDNDTERFACITRAIGDE